MCIRDNKALTALNLHCELEVNDIESVTRASMLESDKGTDFAHVEVVAQQVFAG